MITKEQAIAIAEAYLLDKSKRSEYDLVLLQEHTIEFELGWVFFYQNKEFIETRDISKMLLGNAPFIVDKGSGEIHLTGTARHISRYIVDYLNKNMKSK